MAGTPNNVNMTIAETGLPGSPTAGLPSTTARMVGLPGRAATPCTSTPGAPSRLNVSAVRSRALTLLPAVTTSMSAAGSAACSAARSAPGASETSGLRCASAPARWQSAWIVPLLMSRIWPGRSAGASGGTSSSPVENRLTSGRLRTGKAAVMPSASSAPTSCGWTV